MEVMEDGNLMDRIHVLLQRDMQYYKEHQSVLQESICSSVVGGKLDFPRHASFAAVKLVLWWEEEFIAAYRRESGLRHSINVDEDEQSEHLGGCGGIIQTSDPTKFVSAVAKSADQILDHLHVLSQESLDHADLTVLTGTIGASALLKNSLWCYLQNATTTTKGKTIAPELSVCFKKFQEMEEALVERLLDLHCRLLSLYILQDADSLDWESNKAFFDSERGSFIIQMWWSYMQGTRKDLWNTVPPKMAQRVFSGMLNESLTILTVRYTQALPSERRSQLLAVDISNLLLCVNQLLPAICETGEEFCGLSLNTQSKIIRDIHAKCQELFVCFLLRGSSMEVLYKVFRRGLEHVNILKPKCGGPACWLILTNGHLFPEYPKNVNRFQDLPDNAAIALDLAVLVLQPQLSWSLLLKVLLMRECKILTIILKEIMPLSADIRLAPGPLGDPKCGKFLCNGEGLCKEIEQIPTKNVSTHIYDIVEALSNIVISIGNEDDLWQFLLREIEKTENWYLCFDRRQVWNQKRPPWLNAILDLAKPILPPIIETAITATKTGASTYQAMSVVLACFCQFWDCAPPMLTIISECFSNIIPANINPSGNSVLLQLLMMALYTELFSKGERSKRKISFQPAAAEGSSSRNSVCSKIEEGEKDEGLKVDENICIALAEALCSIDEDNKHTEQIEELVRIAKAKLAEYPLDHAGCRRAEESPNWTELLVGDILMAGKGKRSLMILYCFLLSNVDWVKSKLGVADPSGTNVNFGPAVDSTLLYTMFHIGHQPFDEFLTGRWKPDLGSFLQIPMGLSIERLWQQVSMRWEFRESNASNLSPHDARVVYDLTLMLKQ